MAVIHPFNAWRPKTDDVEQIACVPYDVISVEEARTMAADNPKSFLHVVRPEIDLPKGTNPYHDDVYNQGAENLKQLITDGTLTQDKEACIYIYQLIRKGRRQTGIFTCVSVDDYDNEVILKHELTRPKKEDDRTKHILSQQAHAEPVMLTYKDDRQVQNLIDEVVQTDPLFDFEADDGVVHKIWKTAHTNHFVKTFEDISNLYIADGHHRCKAASRAAKTKEQENDNHTGDEAYNFFPAVIFPMSNMHIMAYNRVIHSVPGNFYETLDNKFDLLPANDPTPSEKGNICIYINGQWYSMQLPITDNPNSVEQLDVHRLQEHLLAPLLDITDPRRDDNISFVGGIRGTEELEELVDSNTAEMAISMYPTDISELVEVSDAGKLMPPKSTWFEPKLRSGLLVHTF